MAVYSLADLFRCERYPEKPFWLTVVIYDIPETVAAAIRSLPDNCVGVTLGRHSSRYEPLVTVVAAQRGVGISWVECERAIGPVEAMA